MRTNLSQAGISAAFREALTRGFIREEDTAVMFHDLDFLRERIGHLVSLFPPTTLHALAIKANPLAGILEFTRDLAPNTGVEAASIGEVMLALKAGFGPSRIVFDSPVKTRRELGFALEQGIRLNLDNLDELGRVAQILGTGMPPGSVGIRINPQVGTGTIAESSVAGEYSKFGVPIRSRREDLLKAFADHPWLTGVHLHVGSQGCPVGLLADGVRVLHEFCSEVEEREDPGDRMPLLRRSAPRNDNDAGYRIRNFDIGGGLPISYDSSTPAPKMEDYVALLKKEFPSLFTLHCSLFTEFGRWVYTNAGWTASRVEYVKRDPGIHTAMIHVGADLFVRECLNPRDWQHEYSVLDPSGNLKTGMDSTPWNLAGPLCFSGDILAKSVMLPPVEEGDYLVVHDTGGYTFSMWSRYNSRFAPRILGYQGSEFRILKEREEVRDLENFWGDPVTR